MELVKQKEEFCRIYDEKGSSEQLTNVYYNVTHEGNQVGDVTVSISGFCVNANCMAQADVVYLSEGLERAFAAFGTNITTTQAKGGSK